MLASTLGGVAGAVSSKEGKTGQLRVETCANKEEASSCHVNRFHEQPREERRTWIVRNGSEGSGHRTSKSYPGSWTPIGP